METEPTKENRPSKLDKLLKIGIIIAVIAITLSAVYYFVFKPNTEFEACFNQCIKLDELGNYGCVHLCGRNFSN